MRALTDPFGRRIEYLRVSVTDHCNYRCVYCRPFSGGRRGHCDGLLSVVEMARAIRLFSELGVYKVRLTGGEPLVRRDVMRLVGMIAALPGVVDLSLSTNGHLLERLAEPLRRAGVSRVNISLDSLKPETFSRITRGGDVRRVISGVDAAVAAGLQPVKLNMVVLKGVNDPEIESMLDFAAERGADLRFIETMPVGPPGETSMSRYYPASRILDRVRKHSGSRLIPQKPEAGAGPARCYLLSDNTAKIGVISAISRHFCDGCNRVRLTAGGELVLCLGRRDRVSLRDSLRLGDSDETVRSRIRLAIAGKPRRHDFLERDRVADLNMSMLGG